MVIIKVITEHKVTEALVTISALWVCDVLMYRFNYILISEEV